MGKSCKKCNNVLEDYPYDDFDNVLEQVQIVKPKPKNNQIEESKEQTYQKIDV